MSGKPVPWTEIKALSFDIYGTLVDWEGGMYDAFKASVVGPYIPTREEALDRLRQHDLDVQSEHPTMLQRDVIAESLRLVANDLNLVADGKCTQQQLDTSAKEYGSKIGSYVAFPDTVAAIQRLKKHYKLVPVTNVDNKSWAGTSSGPLKGCDFDAVYTAEDIGSYKPDLKNFHYLIDHLKADFGVEQAQLCHVAQSLHHDHVPAKKFGLPYHVWVDRNGLLGKVAESEQKDLNINLTVHTLGELADIVDEAFGKGS